MIGSPHSLVILRVGDFGNSKAAMPIFEIFV